MCPLEELCCCLQAVASALLPVAKRFCFSVLFLFCSKVGLNVLVQRANKFTPATRLLIQRFVPFPAVGKKWHLFSILKVLAGNLLVAKGHLTPSFLLYATIKLRSLSWCRQQQDGAEQHFGRRVMQSCWWRQLMRLYQAALSTLKQFTKWSVLTGPRSSKFERI